MKKDDVLKRLADLEKLKNDPVALSAAVSELSKEVSKTNGRGNSEVVTDKNTVDILTSLGPAIYVITDKNTVLKFPFQPNFRIYYKGSGKPKAKAEAIAAASTAAPQEPAKEGPKEAPKRSVSMKMRHFHKIFSVPPHRSQAMAC